jgi:uridine kinase
MFVMETFLLDSTPIATTHIAEYLAGVITVSGYKVIGICGPSGSGKTTFAEQLHGALGEDHSIVLKVDSYWRYIRAQMRALGLTGYDWEVRDRKRLLRDIKLLRSGA